LPAAKDMAEVALFQTGTLGEPDGVASFVAERFGNLASKDMLEVRSSERSLYTRIVVSNAAPDGLV